MSERNLAWRKADAPSHRGGRSREPRDVAEEPAALTLASQVVASTEQEQLAAAVRDTAVREAAQDVHQPTPTPTPAPGHGPDAEACDR